MVDDEGWWVYWGISWVGRFPSNRHHDEAPCQILGGWALVHWCLMPPSMLYNGNQWPINVQGLHCILQLPVFLSFLDKLQKRRSCRTPCGWKLFKPSLKPISKIDVITTSFFSMSSLGLPTVFFFRVTCKASQHLSFPRQIFHLYLPKNFGSGSTDWIALKKTSISSIHQKFHRPPMVGPFPYSKKNHSHKNFE